jgi:hypothetical protein
MGRTVNGRRRSTLIRRWPIRHPWHRFLINLLCLTLVLTGFPIHSANSESVYSGWWDVGFGNGVFAAIGPQELFLSADGNRWYRLPNHESLQAITFAEEQFVAVGSGVFVSKNGVEWKQVSPEFERREGIYRFVWNGQDIAVGHGIAVVVSSMGWLSTSKNLIDWTHLKVDASLRAVKYLGGRFVVLSLDGPIFVSADGLTWSRHETGTTSLTDAAYSGDHFVIGGNRLVTSTDGQVWETDTNGDLTGGPYLAYGRNILVAAHNQLIRTSADGRKWDVVSRNSSWNIQALTYDGELFVAVGPNTLITSKDGWKWTQPVLATTRDVTEIINHLDTDSTCLQLECRRHLPAEAQIPVLSPLNKVGSTATGIGSVGDPLRGTHFRWLKPSGDSVFTILDLTAGKLKGGKPRGAPIFRVDRPHLGVPYPHINTPDALNHQPIPQWSMTATAKVPAVMKATGRAMVVVAVASDAQALYSAYREDGFSVGSATVTEASGVAGSWVGGLAGAKAGSTLGAMVGTAIFPGIGTAIGGVVGGLVGGVAGSLGGRSLGKQAATWAQR